MIEKHKTSDYDDGEEKEEKRQMNFFTSSVCDLLIPIAETSLSSAFKQQFQDRKETNGEEKGK